MANLKKKKYKVEGEIYKVKGNWYEYRVRLINRQTGQIEKEWDSLNETYNPGQELSKIEALRSLNEIKKDINIKGVSPSMWF